MPTDLPPAVRPFRRLRQLLLGAAIVASIGVAGKWVFFVVVRRTVLGAFDTMAAPSLMGVLPRVAVANSLRPYVLPPDPTVSEAEAGQASLGFLEIGPEYMRAGASIGSSTAQCDSLLTKAAERALTGLSTLRDSILSDPEFDRFARAGGADIVASRRHPAGADTTSFWFLLEPVPHVGRFLKLVSSRCVRAAIALQEGRPAQADSLLRGSLRASLLVMDEGPSLMESLVGAAMAQSVGKSLARLEELRGDSGFAASIRSAMDSAGTIPVPPELSRPRRKVRDAISALPEIAGREDIPRGLKWSMLADGQAYWLMSGCWRVRGTAESHLAWVARIRPGLGRRASDRELFDKMVS